VIKFSRVFKIYEKNIQALSDVSFEVARGEFVFLTGPSGAGKSTVLRLIYKEETHDMGSILFDGRDISHIKHGKVSKYRRNIGFVFQDFKLLFDRSVYENIALPLEIGGAGREYIKEVVHSSIEKLGLLGKEKLNPWHISGGEKQKVAIARALITMPQVILADEPTGNLDEDSSWEIMSILSEMNRKGTTVIMATHNKSIMEKTGNRVIRLVSGKIA